MKLVQYFQWIHMLILNSPIKSIQDKLLVKEERTLNSLMYLNLLLIVTTNIMADLYN